MKQNRLVPKRRFAGFTDDWELRKLNNLMNFSNGINASKDSYGKGRRMISVMDILDPSPLQYTNIRNSVDVPEKVENTQRVEKGDLIFVRSSEIIEEVGWAKAYFDDEFALYSGFSIRGKGKSDFDATFLEQTLNSYGRNQIERKAGGSTRFNISQEILNSISVYTPDVFEQTKIGILFKHLDEMITLEQRKVDKTKALKSAYLAEMFPAEGESVPKRRFPGFVNYWENATLGQLAELYQPQTIGRNELKKSGVPVFGANGYIGFYDKENHKRDQITISARGEKAGSPSYVKGPVWITGNSMVINIDKNKEINKHYLYYYFLSLSFEKYITGGAQPQLTREVLKEVAVKIPRVEEQIKIGNFFKKLDDTITNQQQKLDKLKATKQAYLHEMFV